VDRSIAAEAMEEKVLEGTGTDDIFFDDEDDDDIFADDHADDPKNDADETEEDAETIKKIRKNIHTWSAHAPKTL